MLRHSEFPIALKASLLAIWQLSFEQILARSYCQKVRPRTSTIRFNLARTRVLDLHRTWRDESGTEHHKTLFAMLREDIPKLLRELSPITLELLTLRRLRLGCLVRHGIEIATGLGPASENRLRSESRILSGSGGVEARALSGQRRERLYAGRTSQRFRKWCRGESIKSSRRDPKKRRPQQAQRPHSIS